MCSNVYVFFFIVTALRIIISTAYGNGIRTTLREHQHGHNHVHGTFTASCVVGALSGNGFSSSGDRNSTSALCVTYDRSPTYDHCCTAGTFTASDSVAGSG